MHIVPRTKWRLGLSALAITAIFYALILLATLFGVGEPPRAARLYREFDVNEAVKQTAIQNDTLLIWEFVGNLSPSFIDDIPPFTVEMQAENTGAADSSWGFQIVTAGASRAFLVRSDGYLSVADTQAFDWREFIHIREDANQLYLHFNEIGNAHVRINGEIAWSGHLPINKDFFRTAVAYVRNPQLRVDYLRIYVGETSLP